MVEEHIYRGRMFSADFLIEKIGQKKWNPILDLELGGFGASLQGIFDSFATNQQPLERETADELIIPILRLLGWEDYLLEKGLSKDRLDIPDGLLFESAEQKGKARQSEDQWQHYRFGLAFFEAKRWNLPLDRRSSKSSVDSRSPTSQMLRYVRRVDDITHGELRWGILTNGAVWRLYYAGSNSVSEQYFEIDLSRIIKADLEKEISDEVGNTERLHWLRVFYGIFSKQAFLKEADGKSTFHLQAIAESRYYEERISEELSKKVFDEVFPCIVKAISNETEETDLGVVRDATLIFLFRLLFILYAEDRGLLPIDNDGYKRHSLRYAVRIEVQALLDKREILSTAANSIWNRISDLFRLLNVGDTSIGLPPYNGGLFDLRRHEILNSIGIPDVTMVKVIDALSTETTSKSRQYINYRSLSVQQLGAIYEKLLEFEVRRQDNQIVVVPNSYTRKVSGTYYTPDDLVKLVVKTTLEPIIEEKKQIFRDKIEDLRQAKNNSSEKLSKLVPYDVATALLNLKICDPAMGSGHFLVSLIDLVADEINDSIEECRNLVPKEWGEYRSAVFDEIEEIRSKIISSAKKHKWTISSEQVDDRQIIRRIFLKRCVYGVDKNPMAVELAKVSLWLHTITLGAPLTFLDHHLQCGDSLFGLWVEKAQSKADKYGSPLFWKEYMKRAYQVADEMREMEQIADSELKQTRRSGRIYDNLKDSTNGLNEVLNFVNALDWVDIDTKEREQAVRSFFDGQFGDPVEILTGEVGVKSDCNDARVILDVLAEVRAVIEDERFLNWQLTFPGIWTDWDKKDLSGGFDAIVGNPPWDRMKLEQNEWFAVRRPEIAEITRAADRKAKVKEFSESNDPLANEYVHATNRVANARMIARDCGEYPLLSGGDVNIYSLFVERSFKLLKDGGMVGLLVPSGIAHDLNASAFFRNVTSKGQLRAFYDFVNGAAGKRTKPFFPDVVRQMKFCTFIASRSHSNLPVECAFYLQDTRSIQEKGRTSTFTTEDFFRFNPNTGTMPIFKSARDAEIAVKIYQNSISLVDKSSEQKKSAWPVEYKRVLDMTNKSSHFRTRDELEGEEAAYALGNNIYGSPSGKWYPLYVGKMIHQFDHRAASVKLNPANVHNPAVTNKISESQKADPVFSPTPLYWINEKEIDIPDDQNWVIAFRDIARATDSRTMIAAAIPRVGVGNTAPVFVWDKRLVPIEQSALLLGNMGATIFDYATRQKVQGTNLNWYIVEQLPVISQAKFDEVKFGSKSAADIVKEIVLELTYTAHDIAAFAREMGYVDKSGRAKTPFVWNNKRRLNIRAKLDAVFFHLYGLTTREDIEHIYSTFPIVRKDLQREYGDADISLRLCLNYVNALSAGDADAHIVI